MTLSVSDLKRLLGITGHALALTVEHVFDGSLEAGFIPKVARAPVGGPIALTMNIWEHPPQCASGIGLEIGKHAFRRGSAANDSMDVSCPDVESMGHPFAMYAGRSKCVQYRPAGCRIEGPGALVQMRTPIVLSLGIRDEYKAALDAMLRIHPALFRTRQVRSVGGERQKIGQRRHMKPVVEARPNSRRSSLRSLTLPAPFRDPTSIR